MNHLARIINKYDYISFDVFDTLIVRTVDRPDDVFSLMSKIAEKYSITNFSEKRKDAERRAIECSSREEITFDEIYEHIDLPTEKVDFFKQEEIKTELAVCKANPYFAPILELCKSQDKKIVIISDMYMSGNMIEKILNNAHIEYDYMFVSSEYGYRKSRGKLYRRVLNELKIKSNQILHIGDNLRSDYVMARINGIRAIRYNGK